MESLAGHQAPDRLPQRGLVAVDHCVELGLSGKPAGKQQRGATQRPRRRGKGDAVEESVRGKQPGRGLAPQRAQELLHVGEVGRSGHHLDAPAVGLGSLDLVEDQVSPALDRVQEVLEHRQVRSLVALHVLSRQHQPRMAGRPALDVAVDALRLHDRRRDVVAEQSARGLRRRRDASPRLARRREPRLQGARDALLEPARLGTLSSEGRTDGLRLDRVADLLQAFMSRLAPRLQDALKKEIALMLGPESLLLGLLALELVVARRRCADRDAQEHGQRQCEQRHKGRAHRAHATPHIGPYA